MARVGKKPKAVKAWALVEPGGSIALSALSYKRGFVFWLSGQAKPEWIRVEIRPLPRAKGRGSK